MEKKHYLLNVPGKHGYSFMVLCGEDDPENVIDLALENSLFDDERDADYCIAEEASDYDIKHFKQFGCITEI